MAALLLGFIALSLLGAAKRLTPFPQSSFAASICNALAELARQSAVILSTHIIKDISQTAASP